MQHWLQRYPRTPGGEKDAMGGRRAHVTLQSMQSRRGFIITLKSLRRRATDFEGLKIFGVRTISSVFARIYVCILLLDQRTFFILCR